MMFAVLVSLCLALAAHHAEAACSGHSDGACSLFNAGCPSGSHYSYSGCGFLEFCCWPDNSGTASTSNGTCGIPTVGTGSKIVGGTSTSIESYPWQVSVRYNGYHMCGGSLIAERWVLTAAHCLVDLPNFQYNSQVSVLVGSSNIRSHSSALVIPASEVLIHQSYDPDTNNDIGMIKLSKAVDLTSRYTRAICLPSPGEKFDAEVCVATGWGAIQEKDGDTYYEDMVSVLRQVALPVINHNLCTYYMGRIYDKTICAGESAGGKDTCQGDSGGPLVCKGSNGAWKQAGIVSTGYGCARRNTFGIYTEVSAYNNWIESVMKQYA